MKEQKEDRLNESESEVFRFFVLISFYCVPSFLSILRRYRIFAFVELIFIFLHFGWCFTSYKCPMNTEIITFYRLKYHREEQTHLQIWWFADIKWVIVATMFESNVSIFNEFWIWWNLEISSVNLTSICFRR